MKELIAIILISIWCPFLTSASSSGDSVDVLKEYDSVVFSALHNHSPELSKLAYKFEELANKYRPSIYRVNAYTALGIMHKDKGYYVTALNYYLQALNESNRIDDTRRKSAILNNIGSIYKHQENYLEAKRYFFESLHLEEERQDDTQRSIRLFNIGEIYLEEDSLDLALSYLNQSLRIEASIGTINGRAYAMLSIAKVYIHLKRITDAQIILEELKFDIDDCDLENRLNYQIIRARIDLINGTLDKALQGLRAAESLSIKSDFKILLDKIYEGQIECFKAIQDWKSLSDVYEKYLELEQKLNSTKVKNQIEDLTFQNRLERKNLEIELLQQERDLAKANESAKSEIAKMHLKTVLFLIVSVLFLVGLIIYGVRKVKA